MPRGRNTKPSSQSSARTCCLTLTSSEPKKGTSLRSSNNAAPSGLPFRKTHTLGRCIPATLLEAAKAGILAEEANVKMYDELLKAVEGYEALAQVFIRLQSASANRHLAALQRAEANAGQVTLRICDQAGCLRQQGGCCGQFGAGCRQQSGQCQALGFGPQRKGAGCGRMGRH